MTYSQEGEEEVIRKWFGERKGRFLDIGAWDAKTFSNTRALYERGWNGVLVDASPFPLCGLIREYKDVPDRIAIVGCAVAPEAGLIRFYDSGGDGVSTTSHSFMEIWKSGSKVPYTPIWVASITPSKLLESFPGPYDLVSIDTEGTSLDIFKAINWDNVRAEMVIVEHDGSIDRVSECGVRLNFRAIHRNSNNVIFVRR